MAAMREDWFAVGQKDCGLLLLLGRIPYPHIHTHLFNTIAIFLKINSPVHFDRLVVRGLSLFLRLEDISPFLFSVEAHVKAPFLELRMTRFVGWQNS